jgi:hypothetical protein
MLMMWCGFILTLLKYGTSTRSVELSDMMISYGAKNMATATEADRTTINKIAFNVSFMI